MNRPIRILIAKVGLDGHDRGAKVVASALRDAGMEVIYTGLHQAPEQVAATARDEDVDAVGVSSLSGAHMTVVPRVKECMDAEGLHDVVLIAGGIVPADDAAELLAMGVGKVFRPGTASTEIIEFLNRAVAEKRGA
jgi:methylmalonyl-CoA mutase C-terminal domain/subunit